MFYWRVDGLGYGCGFWSLFSLRCLLERRPGILRGRPWATDLYDLSWWGPFRMVVCGGRFFVGKGRFCGGRE